jgi:Holliday junction resolvase
LSSSNLNYKKGRALEYECKKVLESMGYFCIRSAGSHSPADLVAAKAGQILLVQVQKGSHLPREKERALKAACKQAGAIGLFAYKRKGSWFFMRIYPERPVSPQMLTEFLAGGYRPPAPPMLESACSVADKRFPPEGVPQAEAPPQNPAATSSRARLR